MYTLRQFAMATAVAVATFLFSTGDASAQSPEAINYQAIARDTSGAPLANETIDVVFTIIDSVLFTEVYEESWDDVVTNRFGLFTLQIGRGTTVDDFTNIDWASGSKFLQVNIDGVDMGNATELVSVPYALYAESAGNVQFIDSIGIVADSIFVYTNQGKFATKFDTAGIGGATIEDFTLLGDSAIRIIESGQSWDVDLSIFKNAVNNDNDSINELQSISLNAGGDSLVLSDGGGSVPIDTSATNERVSGLFITPNTKRLIIVEGGVPSDSISLGEFLDNTDTNVVSGFMEGTNLVLETNEGDTFHINLSGISAADSQDIFLVGTDSIAIEDGQGVNIGYLATDADLSAEVASLNGIIDSVGVHVVQARDSIQIVFDSLNAHIDLDNDTSSSNELISSVVFDNTSGILTIVEDGVSYSDTINSIAFDDTITGGYIDGTDLVLEDFSGDTTQIDIDQLTFDSELASEVSSLNSRIDSVGVHVDQARDSIQIVFDSLYAHIDLDNDTSSSNELISSVVFDNTSRILTIVEDGVSYTDTINSIAFDDTITGGYIDGTDLVLEDFSGDTTQIDIDQLTFDSELASEVASLNSRIDSVGVHVDQARDSIQIVFDSLNAHIDLDNDTSSSNELISSVVFDNTSRILTIVEDGVSYTDTINSIAFTDTITGGYIDGTDLILEDFSGDTTQIDIDQLTFDAELAAEVASLNGRIDSVGIHVVQARDSIQIVFDSLNAHIDLDNDTSSSNELISSVVFDNTSRILTIVEDGVSYTDTINSVAFTDTITGGYIDGTDLILEDFSGDTTQIDIDQLTFDAELAAEVASLNGRIDSVGIHVVQARDSIQIVFDSLNAHIDLDNDTSSSNELISSVVFDNTSRILTIVEDGVSYTDTINSVAFTDTITGGYIDGTDLILEDFSGDTTQIDIDQLTFDAELAAEVTSLNGRIDSVGVHVVQARDSIQIVFDSLNAHIDLDNDTSSSNELISSVVFDNTSRILTIVEDGVSYTDTINSVAFTDTITGGYIDGTDLILEDFSGDTTQIDIDQLTFDSELASEVSSLNSRIDSVGVHVVQARDSIQIIFDSLNAHIDLDNDTSSSNELISSVVFDNTSRILTIVEDGVSYTDTINSVPFTDTITAGYIDGTDLVLEDFSGDTTQIDIDQLTFDSELASEVSSLNSRIDSVGVHVDQARDSIQIVFDSLNAHIDLDNDTSSSNELISSVVFDNTSRILTIVEDGVSYTDTINSVPFTDTITAGYIDGTDLVLEDFSGDTTQIDIDQLTFDAELAAEVSSLNSRIDSVGVHVDQARDSIQIVFDSLNAHIDLDNDTSSTNEIQTFSLNAASSVLALSNGGGAQAIDTSNTNELVDSVQFDAGTSVLSIWQGGILQDTADLSNLSNVTPQDLDSVLSVGNMALSDTAYLGGLSVGNNASNTALINANDNTTDVSLEIVNGTASGSLTKGVFSTINGTGNGDRYAVYGESNNSGSGDKFGVYGSATGNNGNKYGIYGKASGAETYPTEKNYGGYFEGLTYTDSLTIGGLYIFPLADGNSNEVMVTDGNGKLSFVDPNTLISSTNDTVGIQYILDKGSDANGDTIYNLSMLEVTDSAAMFFVGASKAFVSDTLYVPGIIVNDTAGINKLFINGQLFPDPTAASNNDVLTISGGNMTWAAPGADSNSLAEVLAAGSDANQDSILNLDVLDVDSINVNNGVIISGELNALSDAYFSNDILVNQTMTAYRGVMNYTFTDSLVIDGIAFPDTIGASPNDVLTFNGSGYEWGSASGDSNSLNEVLAAGNDAGGDSIFSLGFLETGGASIDAAFIDTTYGSMIYFSDTLDGQYAYINRLDGDTLNMNYASVTTVSAQKVLSDSVSVDTLLIAGYKFPDPVTASPSDVLTYNGSEMVWDSIGNGDNLGNHTADTNINLNGHYLSGDGDNEGVFVDNDGWVGIDTNAAVTDETFTVRSPDQAWGILNTNGNVAMGTWMYNASGGAGQLGTFSPHRLEFITNNGGPQMILDTSGRVGIGFGSVNTEGQLNVLNNTPSTTTVGYQRAVNAYIRGTGADGTNEAITGHSIANSAGTNVGAYVRSDSAATNIGIRASAGNPTSTALNTGGDFYAGGTISNVAGSFTAEHGNSNTGVYSTAGSGTTSIGVTGQANASDTGFYAAGVIGYSTSNTSQGYNYGVHGEASGSTGINRGVFGYLSDSTSTILDAGVYGAANGIGDYSVGVHGRSIISNPGGKNYGLYSRASGADSNYAAYFETGAVYVGDSLIIPTNAGAGKVLMSDAAGNARWDTLSGTADNLGNHTATQNIALDSNWISNDGDNEGLYVDTAGRVGIGVNQPRFNLDVDGPVLVRSNALSAIPTGLEYSLLTMDNGTGYVGALNGFQSLPMRVNGRTLNITTGTSNFANPSVMFIDSVGKVGIGTTTAIRKFQVMGTDSILTHFQTNTSGVNNTYASQFYSNGDGLNTYGVYGQADGAANNHGTYGWAGSSATGFGIGASGWSTDTTTNGINYGTYGQASGSGFINRGAVGVITGNTTLSDAAVYGIANGAGQNVSLYGRAIVTNTGGGSNYGLYTSALNADTNFAAYFESGAVYIGDSLIIPTNAGAGKVLTSDADGNASWMPASAGGNDSDWDTTSTGGTIYNSSDTVSIGTIAGAARLNVSSTTDTATAAIFNANSSTGADNYGLIVNTAGNGAASNIGIATSATGNSTDVNYGIAASANGAVSNIGMQGSGIGTDATGVSGVASGSSGPAFGLAGLGFTVNAADTAYGLHAVGFNIGGGAAYSGYFELGDVYINDTLQLNQTIKYINGGNDGYYLRTDANGVVYADTLVSDACPAGYVAVPNQNYCIQATVQTGLDWFDAADDCASEEASLPTWSEWYVGTQVTGVTYTAGSNWEWINQASQNNASIVGGGTAGSVGAKRKTVSADNPDSPSNTVDYRCVYHLKN